MDVREYLRLYFIMGSNNCLADPLEVLDEALQGGITLFQFREKGETSKKGKEKFQLAKQMKDLCDLYRVPFIVNDDVDLAIEINAAGIHVGQDDEPIQKARQRCPAQFLIGVSATNKYEAMTAAENKADYIGAGPVFVTSTKEDAKLPIGLEGIKEISQLIKGIPLVAIGGINMENAASIIEAGADGVSLISAISQHAHPNQSARELRGIIQAVVSRQNQ